MIPLQLELTNFLSYRETAVLGFDGIHLACISGANGAGKSSLLDAMTWSLFGKCRSKSDDDVVNRRAALNRESAVIKFTFALEGGVYRVIRRKKRGQTVVLELQMSSATNGDGTGRWKSLSEGGVRDTQAAVEELLRMNYDTFTNASFLLQGQADEFTTKTAGKRKEILADLLGVSRWDQYREQVAVHRKEAEGQLALQDARLEEIENELATEPEREAALETAESQLETIQERLRAGEALLQQMRRTEQAIQQQKETVKNVTGNLERAQRALADRRQSYTQRQQEREQYQSLLDEAEEIEAQLAAFQEADQHLNEWQAKADQYNKLQQARRPHELAITQARSRLQQRQQELEAQAQRVRVAADEREQVAADLETVQEELAATKAELAALARQEEAWRAAQNELQTLEHERQLRAQELNQLRRKAAEIEKLQQERKAVVANAQQAEVELAKTKERLADLSENRQRHANAKADLDSLRARQPRLREQMDKLKERLERLGVETGGECPLCGQPLSDEHRQDVLAQVRAEGKELGDHYRDNQQCIGELEQEVAALEKVLKQQPQVEREEQTQRDRLSRAQARLEEIEREVGKWEESSAAQQLADLEAALADETALTDLRERVAELGEAIARKTELEQQRQQQERHHSQLEARLAEVDRATQEWESTGNEALETVKAQLVNEDFAPEAQHALAELDTQIAELEYETEAHESARQARDELAEGPQRHQQLKEAQAAVKPLEANLADLKQQIEETKEQAAELEQQRKTAVTQLESLQADGGDLRAVEEEVFQLREEKIQASQQVAVAQSRLQALDGQRRRRKQIKGERAAVTQRIQRLKMLEKACGRDGVQALLIEQALPDIEDRANQLLERLTGGQMHVRFETQRQLKSRDATVETLDIRIIDNAGERPYENFSGGEQFRVNFAIRLALSQILAKRAGARLQTLVIDEGFGSQDPNGRQRLVEAINTIQDDFARILVITHIDELRDAFPTRIEVVKDASGSAVTVV